MGRAAAPTIARELMAAGMPAETPVMVAVNVSLPNERLITGRLDALGFLTRTIGDKDPALLLIGEAVGAHRMPAGKRSRHVEGVGIQP